MIAANIVSEKDGIPIIFPDCKRGFGIRVVHEQNPKAPSKNLSMTVLYIAPGGILENHHHENEEIYYILEGNGTGHFGLGKPVSVEKGMFFHLPDNAEHGIENTGGEMMKILISTSPTLPLFPEWKTNKD